MSWPFHDVNKVQVRGIIGPGDSKEPPMRVTSATIADNWGI